MPTSRADRSTSAWPASPTSVASVDTAGLSCSSWRRSTGAGPTTPTSAIHSTSCSGSRRSPTSPPGSPVGGRGAPDGTSSARPWCCASSVRRSTSTEAGGTWSSRTTSARPRSPSRSRGSNSSASGSMSAWSGWAVRRCPNRSATSSSSGSSARSGTRPPCVWPCWRTTTARTGTGARTRTCPPRRLGLALWRSAPDGDGRVGLGAVRAALDDDLDTPAALRALDEEATSGRPVGEGARLLGVDL